MSTMPISKNPGDIPNEDIDTSEIPELDDTFFAGAILTRPGENLIDKVRSTPPLYTIDADEGSDESWTLEQILKANEPSTFDTADIERIKALPVGGQLSFGGGAWAEFTIKRVS